MSVKRLRCTVQYHASVLLTFTVSVTWAVHCLVVCYHFLYMYLSLASDYLFRMELSDIQLSSEHLALSYLLQSRQGGYSFMCVR